MIRKSSAGPFSQSQAADRLGLSRQRVGALIKSGRIKAKDVAGRPVISEQELTRFEGLSRKPGRPSSKG